MKDSLRTKPVAVVKWSSHDELAEGILEEVARAGYTPAAFGFDQPVPADAGLALTFAPYGAFLPLARQVGLRPPHARPLLAHWNFEGIPNPRLPWSLVYPLSVARSRLGSMSLVQQRMLRFRYVGDYFYAYRRGWLQVLAVVSEIYARHYQQHGLPAHFVPWGTSPRWYDDLQLERDIDVLWFGKRRNARRSGLIDAVRAVVEQRGYRMLVVDGVAHPFIFGKQRTEILNRTKIVLNAKTLAHNSGFTFRFHMAAGNRALVVSEEFVRHVSRYESGTHYATAPPAQLASTVLYYLEHPNERRALAENAYNLVTREMTLGSSIRQLIARAQDVAA